MKNIIKKITKVLDIIYGWGIFVVLFAGGLTVIGFVGAFIIGGETATQICLWIQKTYFPVLIYISSLLVLIGLLNMYLKKEKSLNIKK